MDGPHEAGQENRRSRDPCIMVSRWLATLSMGRRKTQRTWLRWPGSCRTNVEAAIWMVLSRVWYFYLPDEYSPAGQWKTSYSAYARKVCLSLVTSYGVVVLMAYSRIIDWINQHEGVEWVTFATMAKEFRDGKIENWCHMPHFKDEYRVLKSLSTQTL